jgi:surface protein
MKETIFKLLSKDLSVRQMIKEVEIISADFLIGQLKVLFKIILEEECTGGCAAQLSNSALANSVESTITGALETGEFVQSMQNITELMIASDTSLANDTILSEVKTLNLTGAAINITASQLFCFLERHELKAAVNNYINEGCEATNTSCATRTLYGEIGTWCVKYMTDMSFMFAANAKNNFNSIISNWNVSSVTNMHGMFSGASSFNSDISRWDVGRVTDMGFMFEYASS